MTRMMRRYTFAAAHRLRGMPRGHKCGRVHGHNYAVEVVLESERPKNGLVLDAGVLDILMAPLIRKLDHRSLNETLRQPTCENLAAYVYAWIRPSVGDVASVRVYESERLWAEVIR